LWGKNSPALQNINLKLKEGTLAFIVGKNGSGKTSLLKAILDEIPHRTGKL
jgi:ABC-type Mn2+/Zn2+ transport system ATPase subunit